MLKDSSQYTARAIQTASPGQLVVMLYDGLLRFLNQSRVAMERRDLGEAGLKMSRAQAIVTELRCTLDITQGPIAENLARIYDWTADEMLAARLENDAQRIARLAGMLGELRDTWAQIANTEKPRVESSRPVVGVNLAG
ncbi:MAG: flagellar export chaperone FliS [Thermoleophilia bacterium]|nr:flagellar export chaperone FliS [Thermoleophilia bacterium]